MDFGHLVGLLLDERFDPVIVGEMDATVAVGLGATTQAVCLSYATVRKQRDHHPEIVAEHYRVIPMALAMGEYRQNGERKVMVIYTDTIAFNASFRVCVKATVIGDELFVTSFHKLRDRKLRQIQRQGAPIIRPHR